MKKGFTLSEILITLAIIGVVAGISIPNIISKSNEVSWGKAKDGFEYKLTQATKQMNVNQVLQGYSTTSDFVDEFVKYIKIVRRCDSSSLTDCFVNSFHDDSGEEVDTSELTTGANFGKSSYNADNVGLVLPDGTSAILAFDPTCTPPNWYSSAAGNYAETTAGKSYTAGETTSCISMVYDVNGGKGPNIVGKDIVAFNSTITTCTGYKIGGLCVHSSDITSYPADGTFTSGSNTYNDYWSGAKKVCSDMGMRLPTRAELSTLRANKATIGGFSSGSYWSSEEASSTSAYDLYSSNGTFWPTFKTNQRIARCVR